MDVAELSVGFSAEQVVRAREIENGRGDLLLSKGTQTTQFLTFLQSYVNIAVLCIRTDILFFFPFFFFFLQKDLF